MQSFLRSIGIILAVALLVAAVPMPEPSFNYGVSKVKVNLGCRVLANGPFPAPDPTDDPGCPSDDCDCCNDDGCLPCSPEPPPLPPCWPSC